MKKLKEKVALIISGLALVISVIGAVNTEMRAVGEKQRAIRSQLTDVLSRMMALNLENAKLFREAGKTDPLYYQAASSALNQQNAFLIDQAVYLTDQIPNLVSAVELNTVALANANAGNIAIAEKYYLKAMAISPSNYYKSLATRSYAAFLFPQRRFEEGREQFKKAIALLKGGDNIVRFTNGVTYQTWAFSELTTAGSPQRAEELFQSAKNEFTGIDNEFLRNQTLVGLEATKNLQLSIGVAPNLPLQPTR